MQLTLYLSEIAVAAVVGAGVMTGLLWAFSNFVLQSLRELPVEHGMFAMQRINAHILNPLFFLFFMGTPVLCGLIVVGVLMNPGAPGAGLLAAGALAYVAGPFGITMAFNVPLNDRLARTPVSEAATAWPAYAAPWQRWNHIRSYLGIFSILLLAAGLAAR